MPGKAIVQTRRYQVGPDGRPFLAEKVIFAYTRLGSAGPEIHYYPRSQQMPRGSKTVTVLRAFTCYRDPAVGPVPTIVDGKEVTVDAPISGPRTDYEAGAVVTDATDDEVTNWTAAGLVEAGGDKPKPASPTPPAPHVPADQ